MKRIAELLNNSTHFLSLYELGPAECSAFDGPDDSSWCESGQRTSDGPDSASGGGCCRSFVATDFCVLVRLRICYDAEEKYDAVSSKEWVSGGI